jgi:hypothetical protein
MIVTLTGTVSDFDKDDLFGLIVADDGSLLLFNLRDALSRLTGKRYRALPLVTLLWLFERPPSGAN